MPNLKVTVKCVVPGCFKSKDVAVPVDAALLNGWGLAKVPAQPSPMHIAPVRGVCPEHIQGERVQGRVDDT
jgi:hypothetical protein